MLFTLHGFLGSPKDWDHLGSVLPEEKIHHFDLFDAKLFDPQKGLLEAGKVINQRSKSFKRKRVLVGYSLGGRIALHSLIEDPSLWAGAVIISTHPGLACGQERKHRLESDANWKQKFLTYPHDKVFSEWQEQEVFKGVQTPRQLSSASSEVLANSISGWSLGTQEDLAQPISRLPMPVLWVTGEKDNKFTSIAKGVKFTNHLSKHCIVPNAAHRVPWEQQGMFTEELNEFLKVVL